jgi:hypothetical protein
MRQRLTKRSSMDKLKLFGSKIIPVLSINKKKEPLILYYVGGLR